MAADIVKLDYSFSPEDASTSITYALIIVGALILVGVGSQIMRV